ncbi:nitroreductase family protein [Viridibacterium curvum]|uniref:SagB/ThcOx family dehydrogenase n=1 Tax=Viridibacterium curvum TaxID=1101404 RepID=A0ABP9R662_9RHOO
MLDERLQTLFAYHERSKHTLQQYAKGPETLDWDSQPDPFRRFEGSPVDALPLVADGLRRSWSDLHLGLITPQIFQREALAALLELSFGLSAWKQYGPDRWALRCNPSSGNLHPTEAYVIAQGFPDVDDGLYHYAPREHALELRAALAANRPQDRPHLWVALSSVMWREAWKYGERAFRYCQLDTGHALGALRYASALMGWQARVVPMNADDLGRLIGSSRHTDYMMVEEEEPELLVEILPAGATPLCPRGWIDEAAFLGKPSRLDKGRRLYQWPIIDEAAAASRLIFADPPSRPPRQPAGNALIRSEQPAATLIRQRRSAQHFERRASMPSASFLAIARSLMEDCLPFDAWHLPPRIHPVFFVHRVDGIPAGAWAMPRSRRGEQIMRSSLSHDMQWQPLEGCDTDLPLFMLANNAALAGTLRTLCCHQAIGSDACFAVALLADFAGALDEDPAHYRHLFQEAGLIGQALYMEAEAMGLRGTGIGCFFDDALHDLLGIHDRQLQTLYHFTVGVPLVDNRITTEPPYEGRPLKD